MAHTICCIFWFIAHSDNFFSSKLVVAFRRPNTIGNHDVRNDIGKKESRSGSTKCGECKLCFPMCFQRLTRSPTANRKPRQSARTSETAALRVSSTLHAVRSRIQSLLDTYALLCVVVLIGIGTTSRTTMATPNWQNTSMERTIVKVT